MLVYSLRGILYSPSVAKLLCTFSSKLRSSENIFNKANDINNKTNVAKC